MIPTQVQRSQPKTKLPSLVAYPGCNRLFFVLEEAVQVAGGDVVRGGDGAWGQLWIMQVGPDEGTDAQD